jgi:hypothetical protein
MPTVTVDTRRTDGVTFVEACVSTTTPHRIRLESRLDGPIWLPRSGGRADDGWDERGLMRVIPAGRTGFGFATPAPPADPAVELTHAEPVSEVPEGVTSWLDRVEARVETAEELAGAEDLPSATTAMASVGGLAGVESLATTLAKDRRVLGRLSFVPDELRERVDAVELPTATLARIADE